MGLKALLYFCIFLIFAVQFFFTFVPLGNERASLKRIPVVTIGIIILNILVFMVTSHSADASDRRLTATGQQLGEFFEKHRAILLLTDVQQKLRDADLVQQGENGIGIRLDPPNDERAREELGTQATLNLSSEAGNLIDRFREARDSHVFYRFGIAPNGRWKVYQLFTCMFVHGGVMHILGNMIFFSALAISLEALWGRTIFLAFYLIVGVGACIPGLIVPFSGPMFGASGAISGVMGAFLVCLHRTKVKIGWISLPLFWIFVVMKKKPFGILQVPAYIFLPYMFISDLLLWWLFKEWKIMSGTAHSVHVAGFFFGVFFAVGLEAINLKTNFFDLKYSESLVAAELRELNASRQFVLAEQKITAFLEKHPDDLEALNALAELFQKTSRFDRMNDVYATIIRHHLATGDKQAALYAYDSLLSGFPDKLVKPQLQPNDWMAICDYLHKSGMNREAGVEYERMANSVQDSPLLVRACVQGGEAALAAADHHRALKLFEKALALKPSPSHEPRILRGIEKCEQMREPEPEPPKPKPTNTQDELHPLTLEFEP